jgi:RHS repeat-associated protein
VSIQDFARRDNVILRVILASLMTGSVDLRAQSTGSAPVAVTLTPIVSPSAGQPGVTVLNVTGSNFPSGTITPNSVSVTLAPATTGPAMTATVSAVTTIAGSTRRITFQVNGPNVAAPTLFNVSVSGSTSTGQSFASTSNAALTINPPASIQISPTSAASGSVSVTITGQYTNFVSGSTTANFGPGISVGAAAAGGPGPVTVTSPTSATAQLSISGTAAGGSRTITVATGVQQATAAFTINVPALTQVNPNSGQQGQQNLPVAITGQFTHFVQGTTTASFGPGITVVSVSVASPTSATVVISIDPAAAIGPRTVSLTTSAELASLVNGFTVGLPPPMILSVTPNSGQQGQQNLSVTICGSFTHFISTSLVTFSNPLVVAGLPTAVTTTCITITVSIAPTAPVGPINLTVTSGTEVVTLNNGFTVTPGTPAITNVNPNTGQRGQTNLSVAITGQFTHFAQGTTQVSFGSDITVNGVTVASATSLTVNITIPATANLGAHTVTVTTGAEIAALTGGFMVTAVSITVNAGPNQTASLPALGLPAQYTMTALPGVGGTQSFAFTVNDAGDVGGFGQDAHGLRQPTIWRSGVPVKLSTLGGAEGSVIDLNISGQAAGQSQDAIGAWRSFYFDGANVVNVTDAPHGCCFWQMGINGSGVVVGPTGSFTPFIYQSGAVSALPNLSGYFNAQPYQINNVGVAIGRSMQHFSGSDELPVRWFNGQIQTLLTTPPSTYAAGEGINNFGEIVGETPSGAFLWSQGSISPLANLAFAVAINDSHQILGSDSSNRLLLVQNGAMTDLTPFVSCSSPHLLRINNLGQIAGYCGSITSSTQGFVLNPVPQSVSPAQISVSLSGTASGPAGVTITTQWTKVSGPGSVTFANANQLATSATFTQPGTYVLQLTASAGQSSNSATVTITIQNDNHPPSVSAGQSQTITLPSTASLSATVTDDGLPVGSSVTVNWLEVSGPGSVTFSQQTSATTTASFSQPGTYLLRIVVSDGQLTSLSDVTINVNAAPASITSVVPNTGQQGQSNLPVTITGQFTHFAQGPTSVSFGSDITINSVTVASATSLTANITIPSTANLGAHTLTVMTGSELVTLAGAFNVTAANQPPVVSAGPSRTIYVSGRIVAGHDVNTLGSFVAGPNEDQFAVNLARWLTAASAGKLLAVESAPSDGTRNYAPSVKAALAAANFTVNYISNPAIVSAVTLADLEEYDAVFVGITWPVEATISPSVLSQYVNAGGNVYIYGGVDAGASGEAAFLNPFLQNFGLAFDTGSYNGLNSVNITSTHPIFNGLTGKTLGSGNGQDIHDLGTNPLASVIQFQGPDGVYAIVNAPTATLTGSVTDDGLPTGATLTATWSATSGPGSVSFGNPTMTFPDVAGQANFVVTSAAFSLPGTYVVSLTASDSQLSSSSSATITINPRPPAPSIISANPNTGPLGQQNLVVAITGQLSNFVQGTSQVSFGTDITVNSVAVGSPTSLTANITIPPTANLGAHTVIVTTGAELASLTSGFNVTPASSGPTITTVVPNSGQQGATSTPVTITGNLTHFSASSLVTFANPGVTASAPTGTVTATSLTVNVSITSSSALGPTNMTVTTGTEVASLANGFTVTPPPSITVSPNSGQQGQQNLSVNITGQFTHFAQGTSIASFGDGISVGGAPLGRFGSVTVTSPTSAMAQLNIGNRPSWTQLAPGAPAPASRIYGALVYDAIDNEAILFGGDSFPTKYNDVWRLSNANGQGSSTWSQVSIPGTSPTARGGASAFYDSSTDRMIIYGGYSGTTAPCFGDVWALTNASGRSGTASWAQLSPSGGPPGLRFGHTSFYDSANNRMVISGGNNCFNSGVYSDVWVLSNANGLGGTPTWTQLTPSGPSPGLRDYSAAGYDPVNNRMIMFGGKWNPNVGVQSPGDVWVLNNANGLGGTPVWSQLTPLGTVPPEGATNAAVYDQITNRMLIFGAGSNDSDTWILSNANGLAGAPVWNRLGPFSTLPPPRANSPSASAYDAVTDRLITFGGEKTNIYPAAGVSTINDTWLLTSALRSALVGPRNVTVQTATELVSANAGFSVTPSVSTPSVMLLPTAGAVGANETVAITGENTAFAAGITQATFGPSISVGGGPAGGSGPVTVLSPTQAIAQLSIAPNAPTGINTVSVTTGTSSVSPANGFMVANFTNPLLLSAVPSIGSLGQTLAVTIGGSNTSFTQGTTQVVFGSDITVNSITVGSTTSLTANITIPSTANLGPHTITVTTGSEVISLADGFIVSTGSVGPTITSISPSSGPQAQGGPVGIMGLNTHFVQGTSVVSFGPGITVSNVNVTCPTCLTAQLQISPTATPGPVTVTVTTGSEVASLANGFTILPGTPKILSFGPTTGQQGATVPITVTGQFTHFAQGTTQVSMGAGITVSNIAVSSTTSLTAQLAIASNVALGMYTLTVTTGTEVVSVPNVFTVQPGTPIITQVSPNSAQQGASGVPITITGSFTHFGAGSIVTFGNTGLTASAPTGTPTATNLTVNVSITSAAALGTTNVTVTTGTEVITLNNGFTVNPGTPVLLSATPSSGWQGQQNLSIGITGQFTHFVGGTTQVSFGAGITVNSVTVTSSTQVSAVVSIPCDAATGPYSVTVTTGSEVISLPGGFPIASITGYLLVMNRTNTSILRYDTSGKNLGAFVAPGSFSGIYAELDPIGPDGNIYIVDRGRNAVKRFSGSTGAFIDDFVPSGAGGLNDPIAGAFGPDGNLYVTDNTNKVIRKYDGVTKAYLGVFSSGNMVVPADIIFGPDGDVYVADEVNIVRFDGATGAFISKYVPSGYGGMNGPAAVRFGCDNNLYVGTANSETAIRYDATTGLFLNVVADFTQLHARADGGFAFGPDDVVYVGSYHNSAPTDFVYRYKPDGTFIDDFIPSPTINVSGGGLAFQATSGPPALLNIRQNVGALGQHGLSITITGQFTHFTNASIINLGTDITVTNVVAVDSTHLAANLSIAPNAIVGRRNLTVSSLGNEIATLRNAYIVSSSPLSIFPNSGLPGQTELVTITGQGTNFAVGTTQVDFGAGITVSNPTVTSPTAVNANISIASTAALGARTVTVTTGTEVDTLANGFTVGTAPASITSTVPVFGEQGAIISAIVVSGNGTHFNQGTSVVDFGAGISVDPHVQVVSATSLLVRIVVDPNAATGPRTITVTTGTEVATLTNGFAVTTGPVITVPNQVPDPSGTLHMSLTLPSRLMINYSVMDAAVQTYGGSLTLAWSTIISPGTVGFQNQTSTSVSVGFSQAGTYLIRLSATDSQLTTIQNIYVTVTGSAVPPPTVSIATPTDGSEITTAVNVTGSVASSALSNWVVEYEPPGESSFHTLATGTATVTNGTLGTFDPTLLINGIAYLRLTATDAYGQSTTTGPISLILTRNQKIGNFTVSFNDLSVPVAGLPIQIVRTYDSRRRFTSGADFSYGWTLDINAAHIAETVPLGNQWTETSSGGALPNYCIQPTKAHNVTVSMPDGTTYQFTPVLSPQCQSLVPIQDSQVTVTFTRAGATPPNVSLAIMGTNQPFVEGSVPGPVTLTDADLITPFDPDQYILTLPDGRALQISMQFGLQKMTDLNGNTLTATSAGITSSTGKSVSFTRNTANLITKITDPLGNSINYGYNTLTGDLTSVTDRDAQATTFTYDTNHGLLTIVDPRGVQPIKNVYDNAGRLIQHIDAFGNTVTYNNNPSLHQEVVTDRLNNVTVNEYDADGNIVKVTDALNGVTQRTYDSRDNLLTETNALGKTRSYTYDANNNRLTETDPLNKTTTYTYNARNQVLTITDPLNHVTTNTYDSSTGNLISTKDAAGSVTSYTYNSSGLRASMTDPLNNVTTYQYDSSGNLTQQKDPLGNVTSYTYDNNGNKTSETRNRTGSAGVETLVTSYQYDRNNNLIKTTYPDNSTTQIQYNAIGKQSTTIDQLNRQTSYTYDLMGRLTQTNYPDGTSESSTYDAEGDRITSVDRANRTTGYTYDPLKRLTKTTYPDTSTTITGYNAIGEVTSGTDALNNVTHYAYDDAGHRTSVTDALNHVTSLTYDGAGNQSSMTDANNNTTQYQYDNDNRRIKTIYADTTFDAVGYDALGRTTSKTDQAGKVTQFQSDALGRLTQVTDALNQLTRYAYDEIGERISQTDANNHTTTFAYDKLSRRIKRALPLGMSETETYDAAGNLKTKTDFNFKTTTYNYDMVNRLTSKVPDVSTGEPAVSFTYTATGQRLSMADASGTAGYTYDLRDRLTIKATPEGTLSYSYDFAGNLQTIRSSNTNGASVNYAYDALNRLSKVTDNRLTSGVTSYSYDNAGNLSGYLYPNSVQTGFAYDPLNRLRNVQVAQGTSTIASYAYTLGPAGNRTAVAELGGRSVSYTYDNLYRLTNEAISGGPVNGSIGYVYDAVGNRQSRTSSVTPIPAATYTYDPNDRLTTDTYDQDGNTTASGGNTYAYDFENHLKNENSGAVTIVYDGDGNRVSKTAGGVTTQYLVDDRNLTGYAQVLEEISGGAVQRVYTYGLNRISQSQASGISFYGHDGHGNVRLLTDNTAAVTDRYDYDAFGNIVSQSGTTPNSYLYSGEQNDLNLSLYYVRARYMNPGTGRFTIMDSFAGDRQAPLSLHKYLYASANPVNRSDPSGNLDLTELTTALAINSILTAIPTVSNVGVAGIFSAFYGGLPDAVGFGVFVAGGPHHLGIGGYEVVLDPRLGRVATYLFGGFEPSSSVPLSLSSVLHDPSLLEFGVFTTWYWNLPDLNSDVFGIIGASIGGGYYGSEVSPGGTTALLFGISSDTDPGIFGIGGGSLKLTETASTESAMIVTASTAEAEFSLAGLVRTGGGINVGGLAAAVINAGAVGTWVHYTYGRPSQ